MLPTMEDTHTLPQAERSPERERLNPFVLPETARLVKIHAAMRKMSQGELIDELAQRHLAAVTVAECVARDSAPDLPPAA